MAKKSVYLKSVRIQRFRSIDDQTINFAPITVFVGKNDSGKSNILKAINLFFNDEIVHESPYNHNRDFCRESEKRAKRPDEVVITSTVESPDFDGRQIHDIIQKKVWRAEGHITDPSAKYVPPLAPSRNIRKWYSRLNYRYVPANKENKYMQNLMRELHKLFSETIDKDIRGAADTFIEGIRQKTAPISEEVKEILKLNSRIQVPKDLSSIFSLFEFETDGKISLNERGDGIRVRHIPAILNFLADKKHQADNTTHGNTIWGYEEPENNLEMGAAFEQAQKFLEYSKEDPKKDSKGIQILITTHSPAFYHLIKENADNCKGYYVSQTAGKTEVKEILDGDEMDELMGVMLLVAPHVSAAVQEYKEREDAYKEREDALKKSPLHIDQSTIFVEGAFDKKIIEFCIKKRFPNEKIPVYSVDGMGNMPYRIKAVSDMCVGRPDIKIIGLLDDDKAGRSARGRCGEQAILVNTPKIFENEGKNGGVDICLEHLLPVEYWQYAKNSNMLEEGDNPRDNLFFSQSSYSDEFRLKIKYKVKDKIIFAEYALEEMERNGIPDELAQQVDDLVKKLGIVRDDEK